MKDDRGLYYFPFPGNKRVKMYVKKQEDVICFRLWNEDDPVLWMEHGWVPSDAIQQATNLYEGKSFDPKTAYDMELATALLNDEH